MSVCPICFSPDVRQQGRDLLFEDNVFMVCTRCGHGFCSKPFEDFQDSPEKYNQDVFYGAEGTPLSEYGEFLSNIPISAANQYCKLFLKYTSGKSFLEIGCGPGAFLKYLAQHSDFILHGNEISPKACQYAHDDLHIPMTNQAFTKELYLPQTFDMVFLCQVIEHIPDVQTFVRDIHAVCNPHAIVGVVCPNHYSLTSGLKRKLFYPFRKTHEFGQLCWPMHLQGFSLSSLKWLMVNAGFSPVYVATLSRSQRAYPFPLTRSDKLLFPVFVAEYLLGRGNIIIAYFQKTVKNKDDTDRADTEIKR